NEVLARDELQAVLLPRHLLIDEGANLGIDVAQRRLTISHVVLLPAPCSLLRSLVNFLHPSFMPPTLERRLEPLVQDVHTLLLTHKLRRQHEHIRIPML